MDSGALARKHLKIGWIALAVFLTFGAVLEALHAFKVGYYLDVDNETRRLMWRLAHAHGTLLAIVHLAYALTLKAVPDAARPLASSALTAALVAIPGGFFVGGVAVAGGDPSLGIVLVPLGFVALLVAAVVTARAIR